MNKRDFIKKEMILTHEEYEFVNKMMQRAGNRDYLELMGILDKLMNKCTELYTENLMIQMEVNNLSEHMVTIGENLHDLGIECWSSVDEVRKSNDNFVIEDPEGNPGDVGR